MAENNNNLLAPFDIEVEEEVLGVVIYDNSFLEQVAGVLTEDLFYFPAHRQLFKTALQLHQAGVNLTLVSLTARLNELKLLEAVGGNDKLIHLLGRVVSYRGLLSYIQQLKEKQLRRKLLLLSAEIGKMAIDETVPLADQLEVCEKEIFELSNAVSEQQDGFVMVGDFMGEVMDYLTKVNAGEISKGLETGFYDLDAMLNGGIKPGQVIVLGARSSMGKTAFALNIGHHIATNLKKRVAFVSYETKRLTLGLRLLSSTSCIPVADLESSLESDPKLADRYMRAVGILSEGKMAIWDTPNTNINVLKTKIREEYADASRNEGFGAVIVDYLQLMDTSEGSGGNRHLEISKVSREFKKLALELNIPIILLSQINRGVEHRSEKRPLLSDLKESGSIEQDADVVILLYRHEYYYPQDETVRGIAEAIIAKQKDGPTGTVKLNYSNEILLFRNLAR